jgi:hypothetical protein
MKFLAALAVLIFSAQITAEDGIWLLQGDLSTDELLEMGATLSAAESLQFGHGTTVSLTYWLAADDLVIRCATLFSAEEPVATCWRHEKVGLSGASTVRSVSTRRRPIRYTTQPYSLSPRVLVGVGGRDFRLGR